MSRGRGGLAHPAGILVVFVLCAVRGRPPRTRLKQMTTWFDLSEDAARQDTPLTLLMDSSMFIFKNDNLVKQFWDKNIKIV